MEIVVVVHANLGQENTMYYDNVSKKWIDTSEDTDADAANADAPPIANADAPPIGGYPYPVANTRLCFVVFCCCLLIQFDDCLRDGYVGDVVDSQS